MAPNSGTKDGRLSLAGSIGAVLLVGALIDYGAVVNVWGEEPKEKTSEKARQLAVDVVSQDAKVRQKTFVDLINGEYRELSDAERLAAIMPSLQTLDLDPSNNQGLLIEALPRILGSKAKDALPTLMAYIADEKISPYLRGRAMFAVARIAPQNPLVVAALMKVASSRDDTMIELHEQAIEELGKIGQAAESALPMLHELLASKHKSLQNLAFEAIGRIVLAQSSDADFSGALADKDLEVRAAAHEQLRLHAEIAQMSANRKAPRRTPVEERCLTALREILERPGDDFDRCAALRTLSITGPGGDPRMIKALLARASDSPFTAVQALARLDPSDPMAVDVLLESLRRTSKEPRGIATMAAVRGLQRYGANARASVPDLLAGFDRLIVIPNHEFSVEDVRDYLATMVAADHTNVAVISRVLAVMAPEHPLNHPKKPYQPIASLATEVLATTGLPTDPKLHKIAVSLMTTALADPSTAGAAAKVLEKTDVDVLIPDAAVLIPLLVKIVEAPRPRDEKNTAFQARNGQLCVNALRALARLGPAAKEVLPLLEKLAARELLQTYDYHDSWENSITKEARKSMTAISLP